MKVYKVTVMVIDHDKLGEDGIRAEMDNVRYPNHCMYPRVTAIEGKEVGQWDDSNPLNLQGWESAFAQLFNGSK